MLESLIDAYSLENVFMIDKKISVFHCINATDLLITKFSTIAIEAMYLKKPVISVILDGENKFRIYGDAAEYMNDVEDLKKLMNVLVNDDDYRLQWTSNLNENMEVFLMNNFFRHIQIKPSELGANAIDKLIKHKLFKHNNNE